MFADAPDVAMVISPDTVTERDATTSGEVSVRCDLVDGHPPSLNMVSWYRDAVLLTSEPWTDNQTSITLTNLTREDIGDYSCQGHNIAGAGPISSSAFLDVQCKFLPTYHIPLSV